MLLTLLTDGVDITQGNLSETKVFNAILTSKARLDTKRLIRELALFGKEKVNKKLLSYQGMCIRTCFKKEATSLFVRTDFAHPTLPW